MQAGHVNNFKMVVRPLTLRALLHRDSKSYFYLATLCINDRAFLNQNFITSITVPVLDGRVFKLTYYNTLLTRKSQQTIR